MLLYASEYFLPARWYASVVYVMALSVHRYYYEHPRWVQECVGDGSSVGDGLADAQEADLNWKLQISNNQCGLDWGLSIVSDDHKPEFSGTAKLIMAQSAPCDNLGILVFYA